MATDQELSKESRGFLDMMSQKLDNLLFKTGLKNRPMTGNFVRLQNPVSSSINTPFFQDNIYQANNIPYIPDTYGVPDIYGNIDSQSNFNPLSQNSNLNPQNNMMDLLKEKVFMNYLLDNQIRQNSFSNRRGVTERLDICFSF